MLPLRGGVLVILKKTFTVSHHLGGTRAFIVNLPTSSVHSLSSKIFKLLAAYQPISAIDHGLDGLSLREVRTLDEANFSCCIAWAWEAGYHLYKA